MRHHQEQLVACYEAMTSNAGKSVYYADFILELQDRIMTSPSFSPSSKAKKEKEYVLDFRHEMAADHEAFRRGGMHALAMQMLLR